MALQSHITRTLENFELLTKMVLKQWQICHEFVTHTAAADALHRLEENERIIDSLELTIREDVVSGIVLYAPRTMALRQMISMLEMTTYQERIGDLFHNVASYAHRLSSGSFALSNYGKLLQEQLDTTRWMIENAIYAYICADVRLASDVIDRDNEVDRRHLLLMQDLPKSLAKAGAEERCIEEGIMLASCSHHLERIGDNATNIAEAAIFMTEGRNVKHPDAETNPRQA